MENNRLIKLLKEVRSNANYIELRTYNDSIVYICASQVQLAWELEQSYGVIRLLERLKQHMIVDSPGKRLLNQSIIKLQSVLP